jgi:hypothetical protein
MAITAEFTEQQEQDMMHAWLDCMEAQKNRAVLEQQAQQPPAGAEPPEPGAGQPQPGQQPSPQPAPEPQPAAA